MGLKRCQVQSIPPSPQVCTDEICGFWALAGQIYRQVTAEREKMSLGGKASTCLYLCTCCQHCWQGFPLCTSCQMNRARRINPAPQFPTLLRCLREEQDKATSQKETNQLWSTLGKSMLKACSGNTPLGQDAQTRATPKLWFVGSLSQSCQLSFGVREKIGGDSIFSFIWRIILIRVSTNNFSSGGFAFFSLDWNCSHTLFAATQVIKS